MMNTSQIMILTQNRRFFTDVSRVLIASRIVRKSRVSEFRVARSGGHNIFHLYRCERYDRQHLNGSPRQNADSCVETCPKLKDSARGSLGVLAGAASHFRYYRPYIELTPVNDKTDDIWTGSRVKMHIPASKPAPDIKIAPVDRLGYLRESPRTSGVIAFASSEHLYDKSLPLDPFWPIVARCFWNAPATECVSSNFKMYLLLLM